MAHQQEVRVRLAGTRDRRAFLEIDPQVGSELARRDVLDSAIAARMCWIGERAGLPAGYGILSHKFFSREFVELLYVKREERRKGIGTAILRAIEETIGGDRLFTSTNESNMPMRKLLERCGYRPSGKIDNLDPGNSELVFVKFLPKHARAG
jgi:GNAT superfamily N-acetyltransferase